jgi:hypothetical protein
MLRGAREQDVGRRVIDGRAFAAVVHQTERVCRKAVAGVRRKRKPATRRCVVLRHSQTLSIERAEYPPRDAGAVKCSVFEQRKTAIGAGPCGNAEQDHLGVECPCVETAGGGFGSADSQ